MATHAPNPRPALGPAPATGLAHAKDDSLLGLLISDGEEDPEIASKENAPNAPQNATAARKRTKPSKRRAADARKAAQRDVDATLLGLLRLARGFAEKVLDHVEANPHLTIDQVRASLHESFGARETQLRQAIVEID